MTVQSAKTQDYPTLRNLQDYLSAPSPILLKHAIEPTGGGQCLISVHAQQPVGYVLYFAAEQVHITELVVHPEFRRAGRASRLISAVVDRTSPCTTLTVTVAVSNETAIGFYKSCGFTIAARKKEFYETHESAVDALFMTNK